MPIESFSTLASAPEPPLDELALAMAGELREVDADGALAQLDALAAEFTPAAGGGADAEVEALRELLARRHGFSGDREDYYHPDNSMLDLVLERRKGLPILLSTVYVGWHAARGDPGRGRRAAGSLRRGAALLSARRGAPEISRATMEEAIERVLLGVASRRHVMGEAERRIVACHEAGHALVGLSLPGVSAPQGQHSSPAGARSASSGRSMRKSGPCTRAPRS